MRIRLVPADDAALEAVSHVLSAAPVDPPDLQDHAWLHVEATKALRRLRRARDHRLADGGRAWVVRVDERAVGYLSARIRDGAYAETFSVVARAEQGRGIGLAARRLALEELASAGVTSVTSLARPGSASAAISRRLGYKLSGTETRDHPDGYCVQLERYELRL